MPVVTADVLRQMSEAIEKDVREEARLRAQADQRKAEILASRDPLEVLRDAHAFDEVDTIYKPADELRGKIVTMRANYARVAGTPDRPTSADPIADPTARVVGFDPGERFTTSEPYIKFRDSIRSGAPLAQTWMTELNNGVEIMSKREAKDSAFGVRKRAVTLTNLPWSERQPDQFVPLAARPVVLLDLIAMATTDSNSVDYQQQTARTDAAAATAYGTLLPEHSLTVINVNVAVSRIGTWTPATEAQLQDEGQLQDLINADLMGDFERSVENQIVNGTGTPWNGIVNASGVNTQARGTDTWLDAVHKGITQIRLAFGEPNAVGLHPTDLQSVTLQKDSIGNYLFKIGEPPNIWGLQPVPTPVFTQGTGVVANWRWATIWTRQGVAVMSSSEHSDYFLRGQIAVKAEGRAAFGVKRPAWFTILTGL
jgi:Phage capsid family